MQLIAEATRYTEGMADGFTYDVFLSHNAGDKPRVRKLAEQLREAGLRVWLDDWVIRPGDDIFLAIESGLEEARVQVLCLSPEALGSEWVKLERSTVLFRDPSNAGRRFVPLLLADCTLPATLRRYKYVDLRQETQAAFDELLAACRGESDEIPQPAAKKTSAKPNPSPLPEQREPLAVLERILTGHDDWINGLAISPDGTWLVSGGGATVKTWDLETGERRVTLAGHPDMVVSVAITPDSKRILSGSDDDTLRVWDAAKGKPLGGWQATKHFVTSVVALSDQRAISAGDPALKIWDVASQECRATLVGHSDAVKCVAVAKGEKRAVSGSYDLTIRFWNLETGECLATLNGHSDTVNSVQITLDGRFAVSGSSDSTVKIWDLEAGTCIRTFEGHQDKVHSVAISPHGNLVASTGFNDKTVRLWDWHSGACLQVIKQDEYWVPRAVAFSPDGSRLVIGTVSPPRINVYRIRAASFPEPARRYVNAKVVLLGEASVGKTSLAHRLIEDKYLAKDRTDGMNVWPLELPSPPDATIDREALLWDLAGQEDYRLIHRLFLDETSLVLLLINPQKDDPFAEAGDWLKALESAAVDHPLKPAAARRLLIFSQIDAGGMRVSNAKIERFIQEYGFAGWLATSAKTGENCSDTANGGEPSKLKKLIADHIPWEKLPWTAMPRMLIELKNAVLTICGTTGIRLLRFSELTQRLEQILPGQRFGETDVRTAVTLLANQGLARPLKFGDLVLLQPELLNGYATAIIRSARAHRDEIGCVLETDIYRTDFDFTGVDRLSRAQEELLLRAMVQTFLDHSLCIAEESPEGRQLVFPSQYRRERDIPREPDVFVSYTFSGEWQTIWTTLVVRLWNSQEFEHRELWRNAAEFQSSKGQVLGMKIDNRQGEGEATISLFFDVKTPDEVKVIFIEYVQRHLVRYGRDVTRDRRYVCVACGTPVRDVAAVRMRFMGGKDFITCQMCNERVPLVDFIEQRLKSDPVARKILAMEETATRQLDTQALDQILIGHVQAITGEANQIFRTSGQFDHGIDGEIEFKDDDGRASGKKVYVQLKSGNSYLRKRKRDGHDVFDVKDERYLEYWISQPVDVYLVIRQTDEQTGNQPIRWMNVTRSLRNRKNKQSRQIVFEGEDLTMESVWRLRDAFFPAPRRKAASR